MKKAKSKKSLKPLLFQCGWCHLPTPCTSLNSNWAPRGPGAAVADRLCVVCFTSYIYRGLRPKS